VGLTIVQRIIERHGGQVRGESKPGDGAVFWFDLP
jgi:signal transduction histidine kinase